MLRTAALPVRSMLLLPVSDRAGVLIPCFPGARSRSRRAVLATGQKPRDHRHKLLGINRLYDVIFEAGREGPQAVFFARIRSQCDRGEIQISQAWHRTDAL